MRPLSSECQANRLLSSFTHCDFRQYLNYHPRSPQARPLPIPASGNATFPAKAGTILWGYPLQKISPKKTRSNPRIRLDRTGAKNSEKSQSVGLLLACVVVGWRSSQERTKPERTRAGSGHDAAFSHVHSGNPATRRRRTVRAWPLQRSSADFSVGSILCAIPFSSPPGRQGPRRLGRVSIGSPSISIRTSLVFGGLPAF
jgi:hypothetical protein